jgi:hypothetical protein
MFTIINLIHLGFPIRMKIRDSFAASYAEKLTPKQYGVCFLNYPRVSAI